MIRKEDIISSLQEDNHIYFNISNLKEYANKVVSLAKAKVLRGDKDELLSYVIYYDNMPEIFISMVWTKPENRGKGLAKAILLDLIESSSKDLLLEVHKNNPALFLYEKLKFKIIGSSGEMIKMCYRKSISIMQPYLFPYIGYFHLIEASELFIFYDDVNYIKKGWINRNRILMNGKEYTFTVPLRKASQNKLINELVPIIDDRWKSKFQKQLEQAYSKAPYYKDVVDLLLSVFDKGHTNITDLCISSIQMVYSYLGKELNYNRSSQVAPETRSLKKAKRLLEITKRLGYKKYNNAIGGEHLYDKVYFQKNDVELSFVKSKIQAYNQFNREFIKDLSIIDILMFNDIATVKKYLNDFELV